MADSISSEQLTRWADSCPRINHLKTLVQREIAANAFVRASDRAERARSRAWEMLNEMFAAGAAKPEGYSEPGTVGDPDLPESGHS